MRFQRFAIWWEILCSCIILLHQIPLVRNERTRKLIFSLYHSGIKPRNNGSEFSLSVACEFWVIRKDPIGCKQWSPPIRAKSGQANNWHATICFNIRAGLMTKAGGPLIQIINRGKVLKWNMHKQTPDAKWHYLSTVSSIMKLQSTNCTVYTVYCLFQYPTVHR